MAWQNRIVFNQCEREPANIAVSPSRMKPGLTGQYDKELREKSSINYAPTPPECMGLEGEYDPCGLVKRVAKALDENAQLSAIDTITLVQKGNQIVCRGQVPDQHMLDELVATTCQVDGTHDIDVNQVEVVSDQRH